MGKSNVTLVALIALGVVGAGIFFLNKGARWYCLNPQYLLWVLGVSAPDKAIIYRGLVGDVNSPAFFKSAPIQEVERKLGSINKLSNAEAASIASHFSGDVYQWDDLPWYIFVKNGKVVEFRMIKY